MVLQTSYTYGGDGHLVSLQDCPGAEVTASADVHG